MLTVEVADKVATVTLDRPGARNALNSSLRRALAERMRELDDDRDIEVVILTGADPAFCAGLDLREIDQESFRPPRDVASQYPFGPMATPVIGAINGAAVTGGLEVALNCHFLIASDRARFADTHSRVGLQPGWGLTVLLPQAVGLPRARQMSATCSYVDAQVALAWGLVNEVVPHHELLTRCRAIAAEIVSNDHASVRGLLRTYDEGSKLSGANALRLEADVFRRQGHGGQGRLAYD